MILLALQVTLRPAASPRVVWAAVWKATSWYAALPRVVQATACQAASPRVVLVSEVLISDFAWESTQPQINADMLERKR